MSEDGTLPLSADEREQAVEAIAAQAQSLGEEEMWDQAHAVLAQALDEHGEHPLLLCWAGLAAQRVGEEGEA